MTGKELGKINKIWIGMGGYDDAMMGLSVHLGGSGWGVQDFIGTWSTRSDSAQWTEQDQMNMFAKAMVKARDLLSATGKKRLEDLVGTPVEVTFAGSKLESWRVLSEVL